MVDQMKKIERFLIKIFHFVFSDNLNTSVVRTLFPNLPADCMNKFQYFCYIIWYTIDYNIKIQYL